MNVGMRFSLYYINFSGADSLHMIYSAELAGIPQSLQSRQNALVGIRETSSWGDGNLADRVFIKNIFPISKIVVPLHFEKMDI